MAKRKRRAAAPTLEESKAEAVQKKKTKVVEPLKDDAEPITLQIVSGSYDQVLHGMTARIAGDSVEFADTFLFSAHNSAIRCVAISPASAPAPGQTQKVFLASGSTDERINIYSLSAHEPQQKTRGSAAALTRASARPILENRKNREVGTLLHHGATITGLHFATRGKLLSASEDSTVAVARTRDWGVLSTVRVPRAKAQGRPSGDTAALGAAPTGVNGFAVHPSLKLMISVSRGERCMRLWNLVTGKKAGVLSFGRELLQEVGESRHTSGEGRRVAWGSADGSDEFAVGFERDVVVFGMDSVPKCRALGSARTKVHQFCYVAVGDETSLLAISTEDGRIVFVSTREEHLARTSGRLGSARTVGQVGGREAGVTGRIKDFVAVHDNGVVHVVGAGSEGTVRVWRVAVEELVAAADEATGGEARMLGRLLGRYETQNRITCLAAYRMLPRAQGVAESSDDESDAEADEGQDEDEDEDEEEHQE
ncbi:hypothetical protein CDD81_575 [Ophiocordyceps australis]|uniref:Anaphase-promoting complex subunit 4 WD40 domain-containing protein n=1 Tax=Ophiocordyceps australis TaxID=1399860 RepID=A0A2C5YEZ6_9HYPO|nr:hypothetical protein CDD81_575 [Ophiocordyceps australis]